MKKAKSFLAFCLIGLLMLGSVSAYAAESVQAQSAPIPSFSLDEVKTLVQKNSANRDSYELQESIIQINQKKSADSLSDLQANSSYWLSKMREAEEAGDRASYNLYYNYYSNLNEAYDSNAPAVEKALDQLDDSLDDLRRQIKDLPTDLDMTSTLLYTKLLELNDTKDLMNQNLNLLLANRKIVVLQQKLGMAPIWIWLILISRSII